MRDNAKPSLKPLRSWWTGSLNSGKSGSPESRGWFFGRLGGSRGGRRTRKTVSLGCHSVVTGVMGSGGNKVGRLRKLTSLTLRSPIGIMGRQRRIVPSVLQFIQNYTCKVRPINFGDPSPDVYYLTVFPGGRRPADLDGKKRS